MDLKATLNLPQTDFPQRANLAKREPELLARWEEEKLYEQIMTAREGRPSFVLHDGPPYANGNLHHGHVLNKVLKDIVVRYRTMSGRRCLYIPGWDCHGLPIEIQVDKRLGKKKADMTKLQVRQECQQYARNFIDIQREEFKRLGCMGRWESPYTTLQPRYEATIVRQLAQFIAGGYFYRADRPVYWCASCRTALAEAEVEYADKTSPSIYVKLPLEDDGEFLHPDLGGQQVSLVIWTTTPWTIPANLAVAIHPREKYVALEVGEDHYIVAESLAESFLATTKLEELGRTALDAKKLEGRKYRHPIFPERKAEDYRVWFGEHVTMESGTGLVHTAPGHGADDYVLGQKHDLDVFAPVDHAGRFTDEVPAYEGIHVHKADRKVIEDLDEGGVLLSPRDLRIEHSYPHCWRCKNPIVFRATPQWFVGLDHEGLREKALAEIDNTEWIPRWGRDRIHGMVANRPDWCLSRQRVWGVPLPILYCTECDSPLCTEDLANRTADLFEAEGSDAWFEHSADDLAGDATCGECGSASFRKGEDIVDVWFESGVSWAAVCEDQTDLGVPVDLYLEGSDQHRGWFHSALLTGVATRGRAPYRAVLTHGFVVDGNGRPMSKSAKNFEPPDNVINQSGAEILRLWVAGEDYRNDIRFSREILKGAKDGYRRIRNTARFMLGNLGDFDPASHAVALGDLPELDRWALGRLHRLVTRTRAAYENYDFHRVYHGLLEFAAVDLSALYLDILKDRVYCDATASASRRAGQTVLYEIARAYATLMAPILCFTAEDIWSHLPKRGGDPGSVHLAELPTADDAWLDDAIAERFEELLKVRGVVTRELEAFRKQKNHSLDAAVTVTAPAAIVKALAPCTEQLADYHIVSALTLTAGSGEEITAAVAKHPGEKCPRCWKRVSEPRTVGETAGLCARCADVLDALAPAVTD